MALQTAEVSRKLTYRYTDPDKYANKIMSINMNNISKDATNDQLMQVADALNILIGGTTTSIRITVANDISAENAE